MLPSEMRGRDTILLPGACLYFATETTLRKHLNDKLSGIK